MRVMVKNCRASFLDIRKAKEFKGKVRFSATGICSDDTTLVIEKSDGEKVTIPHTEAQRLVNTVLKDKFGEIPAKYKNWFYNKADGSTTREKYVNGDGDYLDGYDEDTFYISANKLEEQLPEGPTIVDQKRNPLPASKGHPVSGDYVNLLIDVFAYGGDDGKGVTAALEGIQYLRKGEPFGNSGPASPDAFDEEELEDEEEEYSPEDTDDLI